MLSQAELVTVTADRDALRGRLVRVGSVLPLELHVCARVPSETPTPGHPLRSGRYTWHRAFSWVTCSGALRLTCGSTIVWGDWVIAMGVVGLLVDPSAVAVVMLRSRLRPGLCRWRLLGRRRRWLAAFRFFAGPWENARPQPRNWRWPWCVTPCWCGNAASGPRTARLGWFCLAVAGTVARWHSLAGHTCLSAPCTRGPCWWGLLPEWYYSPTDGYHCPAGGAAGE